METIIIILVVSTLNIACFFIGAKVGQTVVKGAEIKLPDPIQAVRKAKADQAAKRQSNKIATILANADRYDGTPYGQQDVPGG